MRGVHVTEIFGIGDELARRMNKKGKDTVSKKPWMREESMMRWKVRRKEG